MTTLIQLIGLFTFEKLQTFLSSNCVFVHWNHVKNAKNLIFYCMAKLLLGKLLFLLHGEIVVGEVAVGEITDWGNCCWGKCFWGSCLGEVVTGEVALGK